MKRRAPLRRTGFGSRGDRKEGRPTSLYATAQRPRPKKSKGWMTPEIAAKIQAEPVCRNCGFVGVDVHHAVPRSLSRAGRSNPLNVVPICRNCHDRWHAGTPLPRSIFKPDELAFIGEICPSVGWLARKYPRDLERAA